MEGKKKGCGGENFGPEGEGPQQGYIMVYRGGGRDSVSLVSIKMEEGKVNKT